MIRVQTYALATSLTFLGGLGASVAIGHQSASAAPQAPALPVQELAVTAPSASFAVPVTGTVTAEQGGPWNVGILGTPTVNVANAPPVSISNSPAQPFFVARLDEPGRIAYQSINQLVFNNTNANPNGTLNTCSSGTCVWYSSPVPPGHRLVVQHVSGNVQFGPNNVPTLVSVTVSAGNGAVITGARLPLPYTNNMQFDLPVLFYVDEGLVFYVQASVQGVSFSSNPGEPPANFAATGYLLDCSVPGSCAPIAQ
jgi:hypothetical protein